MTKSMHDEKIIILTYEYPPTRGGAGIYCEELGFAAANACFDLEVWSPLESSRSDELKDYPLPFKGSQSLCSSFRLMLEVRKRISQIHSPFLLHVAEPGAKSFFI